MRKNFLLIIISAFLVLSSPEILFAFAQKGQDCSKCHNLSNEQAKVLLNDLVPNIKIIYVHSSPVPGLWEIGIDSGGKKTIIYLDYAKKHILSPATRGELIDLKTRDNLTEESLQKITKVDVARVPLKDALVLGDKNAKYKVIVFSDPDWPYCVKLHQEMKKVIKERKDIAFFIKLFPLPMHKEAYAKSKSIVCEKSLTLLEDAYEKKPVPKPKCETTVIDDNIKLAQKLGLSGTPAVIMPDGRVFPRALDAAALMKQVEKK